MATIDPKSRFALCIDDTDCHDLEKGKVYQSIPDDDAAQEGYLRCGVKGVKSLLLSARR